MSQNQQSFAKPVIILGAPRSGTSLMQRIIRGCPGFVSVAKESVHIWRRYTHPKYFDWKAESCDLTAIDPETVNRIHRRFARYALSSETWRSADTRDVLRYQRNPVVSALFYRPAYHLLAAGRAPFSQRTMQSRLVDKSVHSGLWLPLVDRVFPDAKYVHITRDPKSSITSMVEGWLNPNRFFTYKIRPTFAIPDYPFKKWNFALQPGWDGLIDQPLARVVAHQWSTLQTRILDFSESRRETCLSVKLEKLVETPREELQRIAAFLELPWSDYLEKTADELPIVNARGLSAALDEPERLAMSVDEAVAEFGEVARRIGY